MAGEGKLGLTDTIAEKATRIKIMIAFVLISDCSKREECHFHVVERKARRVNMTQEKMPLIQDSCKTLTILY